MAALLTTALLACAPSGAAILCETVEGPPGDEVTLRIEVLEPTSFEFTDHECSLTVSVRGTFTVEGTQGGQDLYLLIDSSGSMDFDSGVDVNGNDATGDVPEDNLFRAELEAARRAVDQAERAGARVALIRFDDNPWTEQWLTADLNEVRTEINRIQGQIVPAGGTRYDQALGFLQAEVQARGDPLNRPQHAFMTSDDRPEEDPRLTEIEALNLNDMGVRVHTFAMGEPAFGRLQMIADLTGGTFHSGLPPGHILHTLPQSAARYRFTIGNASTGEWSTVRDDRASATFEGEVTILPGVNHVGLTLASLDPGPYFLQCPIDMELIVPRPPDPGNTLRLVHDEEAGVRAVWPGAPDPNPGQIYRVYLSEDREGPFGIWAQSADKERGLYLPSAPVQYLDLRHASCEQRISYDPFPATTGSLERCWSPLLPATYPFASNLTDAACTDRFSTHACDPGTDLSGRDREFFIDVDWIRTVEVEVSEPDLWLVFYGPGGDCLGMGQGSLTVATPAGGLYSVVVDAPPGGEKAFHITAAIR